jgi:hypothetical protein
MKILTLTAAASLALSYNVQAGQPMMVDKNPKNPIEEPCFADKEFQLDIYAAYVSSEGDGGHGDGWGGGLGINYYFQRNVGIGLDATATNGSGDTLYQFSTALLLRYPLELGSICLAPYAKLGGGYMMNGSGDAFLTAGGGIEFRFTPKFGFFTEGSYNWSDDDDNFIQARAGLRFVF